MAEAIVKPGGHGTADDEKVVEVELSKLSEKRLKELRDKGVEVIACRDSVTDHWDHLKGVQPRGWPAGKTWDNVPGCQGGKEVVVATTGTDSKRRVPARGEGHGSVNMTLHEAGHSLEEQGHNSNEFKNARQADLPKLDAYYPVPYTTLTLPTNREVKISDVPDSINKTHKHSKNQLRLNHYM